MRVVRALACGISLVVMLACGGEPPTPKETVSLYLKRMGRDPMRLLPMLTDDFHRAHGMVLANTAQFPFGMAVDSKLELSPNDPDYEVERARLGWLTAPSRSSFVSQMIQGLRLRWLGSEEEGNRAQVRVRVKSSRGPPVRFVFELRRLEASAPWRIDAVRSSPGNSVLARLTRFVVAPDLEGVLFLRRQAAAGSLGGGTDSPASR